MFMHNRLKTIGGLFLISTAILLLVMQFSACQNTRPRYNIGISFHNMRDWHHAFRAEVEEEGRRNNALAVEFASADGDTARQRADIERFIEDKVDLIVVMPGDSTSSREAISRAMESGIHVVVFDHPIAGDDYTAYIGIDNHLLGRRLGGYISSKLPDGGKVVEICGRKKSPAANDRHSGLSERIGEYDGVDLVASVNGDWTTESADRIADSLFRAVPDADAIFVHNSRMSRNIREIARRHGNDDMIVVSVDALTEKGVRSVMDGVVDATMIYPTASREVISTAVRIIDGRDFRRHTSLNAGVIVDSVSVSTLIFNNPIEQL